MKKDFCHLISMFGDTMKTDVSLEPEHQPNPRFIRQQPFR
jgi:hypothetical protein